MSLSACELTASHVAIVAPLHETSHSLPHVQAIARAMVSDGLDDADNAANERAPPDV